MKRWLLIAAIILFALLAYVAAGPWLTVRGIQRAVDARDASALSRHVDFPRLRSSLKAQLSDRLVRRAGEETQSSLFGGLALRLAEGAIDAAVETMITPLGIGALMQGQVFRDRLGEAAEAATTAATPGPSADPESGAVSGSTPTEADTPVAVQTQKAKADYRIESASRISATLHDASGRPIEFVLVRHGLQWKLADIRLPPDAN